MGPANMKAAQAKDTVRVHYRCKLADGSEVDSSHGREPAGFTIGAGETLAAVEDAVLGMHPGEQKTVTVPADQAFGKHKEELVQEVDRAAIPPDIELKPGMQLNVENQEGRPFVVSVTGVEEDTVTLDANHPLAGRDLTFELELVGVETPPEA